MKALPVWRPREPRPDPVNQQRLMHAYWLLMLMDEFDSDLRD